MRGQGRTLVVALAAALAGSAAAPAADAAPVEWPRYERPARYSVQTERDVGIAMRDGVTLRANVARPAAPGRFPVLLVQTPYHKDGPVNTALGGTATYFVERGYAVVTVDVRGTGSSEGQWESFGRAEQLDGGELVEWARTRPWSTGRVGLWGPSYMAITQIYTAALRPRGLRAIFPIVPLADGYRDIAFSGGQANLSFIPLWLGGVTAGQLFTTSVNDPASAFTAFISHLTGARFQVDTVLEAIRGGDITFDGPFWKERSPIEVADRIRVPAFFTGGLHDLFQRGTPLLYERVKRHAPARLLMGPWTHVGGSTGRGLPHSGVPSLHSIALRWFDGFLRGKRPTGKPKVPKVTQWVFGRNRYLTQPDWPDPRLRPRRFFLRGAKRLAARPPRRPEAPQSFRQQPLSGVCTQSTSQWTAGAGEGVPCTNENRHEELGSANYTTTPLRRPLQISGPIMARLWLTTTARDAVVAVRVHDVAPDGTARELTAGWQTASLRKVDRRRSRFVRGRLLQPWHPFTRRSLLAVPTGRPLPVTVEVFPTRAVVRKGHRLRISIAPSDFPHQAPNMPQFQGSLAGEVRVLTTRRHRSYVELPSLARRCNGGCRPLPLPRLKRG